jgi:TorA maturation chaperone TorD
MQNSEVKNDVVNVATVESSDQARRAAFYSLLAGLLRNAPDADVLAYCLSLDTTDQKSELGAAINTLVLAAKHSDPQRLKEEFHELFIGLGRGELVPYGSWYQTGFLMERPLGQLRADLAKLGFERSDDVHEPEDHIAALMEVMAMLIYEGAPQEQQRLFFETHISSWAKDFMKDLSVAETATFYRSVARLGSAFVAIESQYLNLTA